MGKRYADHVVGASLSFMMSKLDFNSAAAFAVIAIASSIGCSESPPPSHARDVARRPPPDIHAADSADGSDSVKPGYRVFSREGRTILVNHQVIDHPQEYQAVLARVTDRLADADRRMGPAAKAALTPVEIWIEWKPTDTRPRGPAEFHESAAWLAAHGYDSAKEHGIEINDTRGFLLATQTNQPQALLHELSHAYDSLVFHNQNPAIESAYQAALASGKYDSVARIGSSSKEKAYALNNAREYFAETSECYLGMNDYFPFVREQLETVDPTGFALMRSVWGDRGPRPSTAVLACQGHPSPAEPQLPTALIIENRSDHPIDLVWIDSKGASVPMRRILGHDRDVQTTYIGHVFQALDSVTGKCGGEMSGATDIQRVDL